MVIFRENTEDIYPASSARRHAEAKRLIELLHDELGWTIRPDSASHQADLDHRVEAADRAALNYASSAPQVGDHGAQGNIQKFTRGAFRNVGL